jgi:hypothetical protein
MVDLPSFIAPHCVQRYKCFRFTLACLYSKAFSMLKVQGMA